MLGIFNNKVAALNQIRHQKIVHQT